MEVPEAQSGCVVFTIKSGVGYCFSRSNYL